MATQPQQRLPHFETGKSSPRFEVNDEKALQFLHDYGYVVIAQALSSEDVEIAIDLFWKFVEQSSDGRVQRNSPKTWSNDYWPGSAENGLFEQHGIGQSAFLWFVRSKPKVLEAFQRIWSLADPTDMVMSFDGCCAFRPTCANPSWRTMGGWYHVDQNGETTGSDRHCVQGFVTLYDQDANTGGLAVLPGSHKQHAELFDAWTGTHHHRDFCILENHERILCGTGATHPRVVQAFAGDLVLWDSRCIHCNVPAWHRFDEEPLSTALVSAGMTEEEAGMIQQWLNCGDGSVSTLIWTWHNTNIKDSIEKMAPQLFSLFQGFVDQLACDLTKPPASVGILLRLVAYVCALPRTRSSPQQLKEKRRAVLLGATATHWPHRAELKSIAPGSPGVIDALELPAVALKLLGCEGPTKDADVESLRAELQTMMREHASDEE